MASPSAPRARSGFKIAVICAVPVEAESVRAVFDRCWEDEGERYGKTLGDKNTYTTGVIGRYNVVLVLLPSIGSVPAAQAAASLGASYPKIELVLVVGVCGVIPINPTTGEEIVLGDVIVSTAVTQYDFGRTYPGGFQRKTSIQDSLRKAPKEVQGFINKLSMRQNRQKLRADLTRLVTSTQFQQNEPTAIYPGITQDHLYDVSYLHQHRSATRYNTYHDGLDAIYSVHCDELGCEKERRVTRQRLQSPQTPGQGTQLEGSPLIHLGRIGSANTVIKSGLDRDTLAAQEKLIAFEMEGAGVWDEHPTIVIKGACDYADSHKHKAWQPYAAMMAAGCLKVILAEWVVADELIDNEDPRSLGFCLASAPLIQPDQFIGRAVEIQDIYRVLQPDLVTLEQRRVVLGGIGGIGKTQLAIAYARRYTHHYTSVLWLNASSEQTLHTSFHSIAEKLVTSHELEKLDQEQVLGRVRGWLSHSRNTRWLLIFDNHDDPGQVNLDSFCPNTSYGAVIVTTRLPNEHGSTSLRVAPLTNIDDSLAILQKRSRRDSIKDDAGARALAERLGGLPLALVTAGGYLCNNHVSFQEYLAAYEQRWQVGRRPVSPQEYQDRTLYTTWDLTYVRLQTDDAEAAQMLKLLAYFDHQEIWYDLFRAGLPEHHLPACLPASLTDQVDFGDMMGTLVRYCVVDVQHATPFHATYGIHSCVHDWTLGALNRDVDSTLYWYASDCVATSISKSDYTTLGRVEYTRVSRHGARLTHHQFEPYDKVGLSTRLSDSVWIAEMLTQQVQLSAAERMYLRALTGWEKALGLDHTDTLSTVNNLGLLYRAQGKLDEAEKMYQRALAGKEKALGLDHTETLSTVNNLGGLYHDQGKLDEAEKMYQRALAGREKALGLDHTDTLSTVNNLGGLYRAQGKLDEAEKMYQRALAGKEKVLGRDHSSTQCTMRNLDALYHSQGWAGRLASSSRTTAVAREVEPIISGDASEVVNSGHTSSSVTTAEAYTKLSGRHGRRKRDYWKRFISPR